VPDLSVTENYLLGQPFARRRFGVIDWAAEHAECGAALARLGLETDPRAPLSRLSAHQRQIVALARALRQNPCLLVLDEVTASLSEPEVRMLLAQVRQLRARGVAIIYVSHRLEEVFRVADRATVLRDGRRAGTRDVEGLAQADLVRMIVGAEMTDLFRRVPASGHAPSAAGLSRLSVHRLGDHRLRDISFDLAPGEILGIAGLGASGRTRLLRLLYGDLPVRSGEILLDGAPVRFSGPAEAMAAGVVLITEDRGEDGFVEALPIWQNVTLPWLSRFRRAGLQDLGAERRHAETLCQRLGVRMPGVTAQMSQLSGGNQQKVLFARALLGKPKLLLLDEPTHGVDIASKSQIYDMIRDLARDGVSCIVVSSEFEELQALSDRVLLLRDGTTDHQLHGNEISKDNLLHHLLQSETTGDRPHDRTRY
jgi:ABC-type sugar transport system ATPase subunit